MRLTLAQEIEKRAHYFEGQGDGIVMVTIRLDEIIAAVRSHRTSRRKITAKPKPKKRD
jgi:hypothetical protein